MSAATLVTRFSRGLLEALGAALSSTVWSSEGNTSYVVAKPILKK